jgi:hypothetical protein
VSNVGGKMLKDSTRVHLIDKWFDGDEANSGFTNHVFIRLIAKGRRFTHVDFKYSIFDACYLRDCVFDSCDFTGCRFVASNLHGSTFPGCKFDYTTFERTDIDSEVLDTSCPPFENLKAKFARTLRMNYQQLGDSAAVNKSISVELRAAETHLHKAWQSNESYYRKKYTGVMRLEMWGRWACFKLLDFIWGNGESPLKLIRSLILLLVAMAVIDVTTWRSSQDVRVIQALASAPQVLLGTQTPDGFPRLYLALVMALRLVAFGFFTSILIKRFSRR